MEEQELVHDVARFVSMDAPQQGAVIDAQLQAKLAYFYQTRGIEVPLTLVRVAGAQLLKRDYFDYNLPTKHTTFYNEIRALNGGVGYPRLTENVGVSFGAPTANPNTGQEWLELHLPVVYPNDHFDVVGDIAVAGSYLPRDLTDLWGRVSWFGLTLTYELERKKDPTFIPYESALDLKNGVSAFDAPLLYPSTPHFHNEVPDTIRVPLLRRLGYGVPPPTQVSISGPGILASGETGYYKANVTPGSGNGYTHKWEYRRVCADPPEGPFALNSEPSKAKDEDPGGGTTNAVNCDEWHFGGITAKFAYRSSSAVTLDIRVRASGGGGSVTSPMKRVYVGGGGSNLTASDLPGEDATPEASTFSLEPVRPHPVRSGGDAIVRFTLPNGAPVRLALYDVLGREVSELHTGEMTDGGHEVSIAVPALPAGVYLMRLTAGANSAMQQLVMTN